MKSYLFVSKIRIQTALAYRFNVISTISAIMGNLLTMGVQNRIADSVRSSSVALDLLKPVNIYGIYLAEDLGDCVAAFL